MQQNKTPKPNQSLLLKSPSQMGTVFLCKCRNSKKNPAKLADSHWQALVWMDPGDRGCQIHKAWLTPLVFCSYIYFFMCRVDSLGKSSQTHVFSSKLAHIGQQMFWWKKNNNLQPGFNFGFTEVSQNEVGYLGVFYGGLSNPGDAYNSQRLYSAAKEQTLLHQMQRASI